ncbi:MAG: hypothetical protein IJ130_02245 [Solobacterium sp.]|nr:hypothetical protein [Solobacterium sp.]
MSETQNKNKDASGKLSRDELISYLSDRVRDDTIAKAAFLAQYDNPDDAFGESYGEIQRFMKTGFGVIAAFPSKDDMDKMSVEVALSAAGYEPVLAETPAALKNSIARTLNTYRAHNSLELYEDALSHFREAYTRSQETEAELSVRMGEWKRCSAAMRSLKEEDSWLNRENKMRVTKIQEAEKQALAHQEAKRRAEETINTLGDQLTDANEKLPIGIAQAEEAEKYAAQLETEIAALEKKNTFIGGLFRRDRNQIREDLAGKKQELEEVRKKKEESLEGTQKLQLEIERLEENVRTHKSEAAKMDSAFAVARDRLIKARQEYTDGEKRFAISQDRIKETRRKMNALDESVRQLEEKNKAARGDCLLTARRVLMAFLVSSEIFRDNLKQITKLADTDEIPEGVLETVLFLAPALFVDWSVSEEVINEKTSDRIGTLIAFGVTPDEKRSRCTAIFA